MFRGTTTSAQQNRTADASLRNERPVLEDLRSAATERFYREALESDEHQSLLDEVSYRGARSGLFKRETAILLTEEWERFTLENLPDDAAHVDFAGCAVRFINQHSLEGETSAFETAVQTTVGIGFGLFRLAFSAVVFLFVMGALAIGCLMLLS